MAHFSKGGYPYPNDLPRKGELSIIVVVPDNEIIGTPNFLTNFGERGISEIISIYFSVINNTHPLLKIDKAPYYIFLDHKGIVFETTDIEDAIMFYNQNVNE